MSATAHDTADAHGAHGSHGGGDHVPHIVPLPTYFAVWITLLVLTAVTVGVSYVNFGDWNILIALFVATVKAGLVAAIFMHLLYDSRFNSIVFVCSVIFVGILIAFTSFDTFGRGMGDKVEGDRVANVTNPFGPAAPKPAAKPAGEHHAGHGEHHEAEKK